jgi:PAS domain-containing protein
MDLIKTLIENGDKIGIGAVCIGLLIIFGYFLKWFAQYMAKDQDKDSKMMELHLQSLQTQGSVVEVAKSIKIAADNVATAQSSSAETNANLSILLQTVDQTWRKLGGDLLNRLDTAQTAIIDALNSRDLAELRKGVLVLNPSGKIISCNHDALSILGMTAEDLLNTTLKERAPWFLYSDGINVPVDEIPTMFALTTAMPSRHNLLGLRRTPEDHIRWLLVDAEPVVNAESRRVTRVIVTFRDVGDFISSKIDTSEIPKVNDSTTLHT